jgi:hypothetical protein
MPWRDSRRASPEVRDIRYQEVRHGQHRRPQRMILLVLGRRT